MLKKRSIVLRANQKFKTVAYFLEQAQNELPISSTIFFEKYSIHFRANWIYADIWNYNDILRYYCHRRRVYRNFQEATHKFSNFSPHFAAASTCPRSIWLRRHRNCYTVWQVFNLPKRGRILWAAGGSVTALGASCSCVATRTKLCSARRAIFNLAGPHRWRKQKPGNSASAYADCFLSMYACVCCVCVCFGFWVYFRIFLCERARASVEMLKWSFRRGVVHTCRREL